MVWFGMIYNKVMLVVVVKQMNTKFNVKETWK